jgi:thioredoxin reductase
MKDLIYDVVIIGAGPADIQAAIHASRKKATVLMLEGFRNARADSISVSALCQKIHQLNPT